MTTDNGDEDDRPYRASVVEDERAMQVIAGLSEGTVTEVADLRPRGTQPAEVEAELRETHLPRLDAAGYIEWDPETGTISKGPRFGELERELDDGLDGGRR
ncbi:hypothetical protein [Halorubrum sp. JWXQ-INN 858]|uniref:DUF7344 domain-containing protein n=1 Tax=Halorubrum sp. JWXQ-INN 858 TaxID=2690782 RepID=UPI00374287A8